MKDRATEVRQQASAVRRAALAGDDATLRKAAATLDRTADGHARRAASMTEIPDLSAASVSQVRATRRRRAVRIHEQVYLPSWRESAFGLPNALLRSALFTVAKLDGDERKKAVFDLPIYAQGDVVLKLTGLRLIDYDRQVLAAVLSAYRDFPLSANAESGWVRVSFWQFAGMMGLSYGLKVHLAIRESLIRLNAAHLRLRVNRRDVPLPRLVEVAFDDGYEEHATDPRNLKGSDLIALRVPEGMAELFGPACWTAIPQVALTEYAGLVRWLTSFFSTHDKPYSLSVEDLYRYSGSDCGLREFRRRLKNALARLEEPGTPPEVRVATSAFDKDKVTVYLERWNQA